VEYYDQQRVSGHTIISTAMKKRTLQHHHAAGVTLIELVIVVGIVAVVSLMVLFNYSKFSTNISVRNLAQEVALSIRKAQSYATSVQTFPGGSTSSYPAYGIAFSLAAPSSSVTTPSQKRFVLFADVDSDGTYDYTSNGTCGVPAIGNECVEGFGITTTDSITQLCSPAITGTCTSSAAQTMTAVFCRPSPDAAIFSNGSGVGGCANSATYTEAVVQSAKGLTQRVRLWNTGQISVQ
jgi:type II secretory pathway pseudopilin PulG